MLKIGKKSLIFISTIILLMAGLLLGSFLLGYRFFFVETPSMGTTAPVGSLVITKDKNRYSKGDVVSYYRNDKIYTHRIIEENPDGTFKTKGDLNEFEDSLPLYGYDIIGSSVYIGKYIGWLWRALPILAIGLTIVYLISCLKRVDEPWRWPIRLIGYSVVVMIATFTLNPWMRVQMLGYAPNPEKGVNMRVVNTGIFPIRDERGGRFFAGEDRVVHLNEIDEQGRFVYVPRPSLGFWGIILVALWCLIPLIVALMVDIPDSRYVHELTEKQIAREKRANFVIFALIIAVSMIILVLQLSSLAAFTARISNSSNVVRTITSCWYGQSHLANPKPRFSYALDIVPSTNIYYNQASPQTAPGNGEATLIGSASIDSASPMACSYLKPNAAVFNGSNTCVVNRSVRVSNPSTFTISGWFKTSKKSNGKIIGFGTGQDSGDGNYDRHIYIDKDGRVIFGLYGGSISLLKTPVGINYADGLWHHVVATLSPSGSSLYLDGALAEGSSTINRAQNYQGYWKIGCGNLRNWRNGDGSTYSGPNFFTGSIKNIAIYDNVLTPDQIKEQYIMGAPR